MVAVVVKSLTQSATASSTVPSITASSPDTGPISLNRAAAAAGASGVARMAGGHSTNSKHGIASVPESSSMCTGGCGGVALQRRCNCSLQRQLLLLRTNRSTDRWGAGLTHSTRDAACGVPLGHVCALYSTCACIYTYTCCSTHTGTSMRTHVISTDAHQAAPAHTRP